MEAKKVKKVLKTILPNSEIQDNILVIRDSISTEVLNVVNNIWNGNIYVEKEYINQNHIEEEKSPLFKNNSDKVGFLIVLLIALTLLILML